MWILKISLVKPKILCETCEHEGSWTVSVFKRIHWNQKNYWQGLKNYRKKVQSLANHWRISNQFAIETVSKIKFPQKGDFYCKAVKKSNRKKLLHE